MDRPHSQLGGGQFFSFSSPSVTSSVLPSGINLLLGRE